MIFENALYGMVVIFLTVGWSAGFLHILYRGCEPVRVKPKVLRFWHRIFMVCAVCSWICLLILLVTLPKFHWLPVILGPPLIIVSALSLWQLKMRLHKIPTKKRPETDRMSIPFVVFFATGAAMVILQFLYRYSGWVT